MAEKRKPLFVVMLKKKSNKTGRLKTNKLEVFPATLWPDLYRCRDFTGRIVYRLRVNGKWWPGGEKKFDTISITELSKLLRKSMLDAAGVKPRHKKMEAQVDS